MNLKHYKVTCKCGHVGKRNFVRIDFPVIANSGKEAAEIARKIPRVKRDHKDAILDCIEISYEEYLNIRDNNDNDPYLKCKNKKEQSKIENFSDRLEAEPRYLNQIKKTRSVEYKIKKQEIIGKDIERYLDIELHLYDLYSY